MPHITLIELHAWYREQVNLRLGKAFLKHFFQYLDLFIEFLIVLITFELILDVVFRIWTNPEIQDGGPRWPFSETITQLLRHVTSYPRDADVKETFLDILSTL